MGLDTWRRQVRRRQDREFNLGLFLAQEGALSEV